MVKQAHLLTGEVIDCNESWVETVRDARGHIARTLGKPSGCIQICVAATILDDDDTLDDRDMNVVVCDMIRPHVNLCCLDARLFTTIKEMIGIINKVNQSARGASMLYFIYYDDEPHARIWRQVLLRTFSNDRGYEEVVHHVCAEEDEVGCSVMLIGPVMDNVVYKQIKIIEAPPAVGFADFGKMLFYVELQFMGPGRTITDTVGVVWISNLCCRSHGGETKPWFSDNNMRGIIQFIMITLARHREPHDRSVAVELSALPEADRMQRSKSVLLKDLNGLVLLMDQRSSTFTGRYAIHNFFVAGSVHVMQGNFDDDGLFIDTSNDQRFMVPPSCYRICSSPRRGGNSVRTNGFRLNWKGLLRDVDDMTTGLRDVDDRMVEGTAPVVEGGVEMPSGFALAASPSDFAASSSDPVIRSDEVEITQECMVCMEELPSFVLKHCGHYGVCGRCRKMMCKAQFNKKKDPEHQIAPKYLKMERVEKVYISCPYCREETPLVHISQYEGTVFYV
jgi:hypothetical protein